MKYKMDRAPMGWNSYDYYDTSVNEAQVKANADFMAAHMNYGLIDIVPSHGVRLFQMH